MTTYDFVHSVLYASDGGIAGRTKPQKIVHLQQSILKRAFEGKLVPQDPQDEPAEELLERIRQQRQSMPAMKPKPVRRKGDAP